MTIFITICHLIIILDVVVIVSLIFLILLIFYNNYYYYYLVYLIQKKMSFRTVITFAVMATAFGFSPSSLRKTHSSLISMKAMTDLPGAVAPLGFFDPAGIYIFILEKN